jgi:hypothetical protein
MAHGILGVSQVWIQSVSSAARPRKARAGSRGAGLTHITVAAILEIGRCCISCATEGDFEQKEAKGAKDRHKAGDPSATSSVLPEAAKEQTL